MPSKTVLRRDSPPRRAATVTRIAVACMALTAAAAPDARAAESDPKAEADTAITLYSSPQAEAYRFSASVANARNLPGYAVVRQERMMRLDRGRSTVRLTDVPALIDPTTVSFVSLSDAQTQVLEQSFHFDLDSTDKLLLKAIDRPITVERVSGGQTSSLSGTLLSFAQGLVIRDKDGSIHALRDYSAITFPQPPEGLETRPSLVWDLVAPRGGEQRVRVSYQTGGMTWWADYNLVFSEGKDSGNGTLDVSAWVSIVNTSGTTYPDAALKLVAGDVNRVPPPMAVARQAVEVAMAAAPAADAGFSEQPLSELHLYTLNRRTTLANDTTKQIELFPRVKQVPARKLLVYAGAPAAPRVYSRPITEREFGVSANAKVEVYLEFTNDERSGLGMPLPAGRVRVSQLDSADASPELIGADRVDHTPKGETVRLRLGSAFDVVGERRQVDFVLNTREHWMEEEIEIRLRNHKAQPVTVTVSEALPRWSTWQIVSKDHDFEKENAHTIRFPVSVPKDGATSIRYRVRYTW